MLIFFAWTLISIFQSNQPKFNFGAEAKTPIRNGFLEKAFANEMVLISKVTQPFT